VKDSLSSLHSKVNQSPKEVFFLEYVFNDITTSRLTGVLLSVHFGLNCTLVVVDGSLNE
jgi:hypothetical protein